MAKIKVQNTYIKGLFVIEPQIFGDTRGYFLESYQEDEFFKAGLDMKFVQDNESMSKQGVLRGLHFQTNNPQGKLVRVIKGEVFDVAVDLREDSETYGKWEGVYLSESNKKMLYIPPGFAHGFLVTSEEAIFAYKCTTLYDPISDSGIKYNDVDLNIFWPTEKVKEVSLSAKDENLMNFKDFKSPF